MALNIFSKWASRSNEPDSNYPTGSFKNRSAQGEKDGTPLVAEWGNDLTGFTDALLNAAGIPHSGLADTVLQSDRLMALKRYIVMRAAAALTSQGNSVIMYAAGLTVGGGDVVIREDDIGISQMVASHRVYYNPTPSSFNLNADIDVDISAGRLKLINIENMISGIASNASGIASNNSSIASNASVISAVNSSLNSLKTDGFNATLVWSGNITATGTGAVNAIITESLIGSIIEGACYVLEFDVIISGTTLSYVSDIVIYDRDRFQVTTVEGDAMRITWTGNYASFPHQIMVLSDLSGTHSVRLTKVWRKPT